MHLGCMTDNGRWSSSPDLPRCGPPGQHSLHLSPWKQSQILSDGSLPKSSTITSMRATFKFLFLAQSLTKCKDTTSYLLHPYSFAGSSNPPWPQTSLVSPLPTPFLLLLSLLFLRLWPVHLPQRQSSIPVFSLSTPHHFIGSVHLLCLSNLDLPFYVHNPNPSWQHTDQHCPPAPKPSATMEMFMWPLSSWNTASGTGKLIWKLNL